MNMKFLIVDDNAVMRQTISLLVANRGDEIAECDDGKDAVQMYTQFHPDWVLMDIKMKAVGGIEATANIIAADPGAKVVILTDYDDRFFRKAAEKAGACNYITKENLGEIKSIVRRAV